MLRKCGIQILSKLFVMTFFSKSFDSQVRHHLKCRYRTFAKTNR